MVLGNHHLNHSLFCFCTFHSRNRDSTILHPIHICLHSRSRLTWILPDPNPVPTRGINRHNRKNNLLHRTKLRHHRTNRALPELLLNRIKPNNNTPNIGHHSDSISCVSVNSKIQNPIDYFYVTQTSFNAETKKWELL